MRASCQEGSAVARPLTGSAACPGAARSTRVQSCCRPLRHECGGVVHGRDAAGAARSVFAAVHHSQRINACFLLFCIHRPEAPENPASPRPRPQKCGSKPDFCAAKLWSPLFLLCVPCIVLHTASFTARCVVELFGDLCRWIQNSISLGRSAQVRANAACLLCRVVAAQR